ncbi:MAG TPA: hypothetical protein VGF13_04160 [Verrucomicrobiae bacterium]|jgi:hypothetical protein
MDTGVPLVLMDSISIVPFDNTTPDHEPLPIKCDIAGRAFEATTTQREYDVRHRTVQSRTQHAGH